MLDAWYDEKGSMKPLDGFCWSYFCGRPKRVVVGGGGDICPSFPELFRYGPNSIWQLRKMGEAKPDAPKIAIPGCEHLEVFGNYARAILDGRTLSRADVNVPCGRDNDLPGIAKRITAFRDKYAAYLVRGQRIGDFVPKEPDDVFGAFWRDKSGSRIAAFIANATIASQTTSFNFPGSTAIIHATVSPCDIAVVYAE